MSPEKARVFIADDNDTWLEIIQNYLEESDHVVVLKATSLTQALEAINQFEKLGIQVAIIDGNLNPYDHNGHDGQVLLTAIRQQTPNVKTIGMSGLSVKGTDVDLGKAKASDLGKTINNL